MFRQTMPRQPKPADLTILSKPDNGVPPGPNSSPINLQGVDLSSFGGIFEQTQQQQGQDNSSSNRNNNAITTVCHEIAELQPRAGSRTAWRRGYSSRYYGIRLES